MALNENEEFELLSLERQRSGPPTATAEAKPRSTLAFVDSNIGKGLAALAGMPIDTMTNVINLGIAGTGFAMGEFGVKPDKLPQPLDPSQAFGGSASIERGMAKLGIHNMEAGTPTTDAEKYAGRAIQFAAGSAVPLSRVASLPQLFGQTAMGATAGVTSMAAEQAFPDSPIAPVAGALIPTAAAVPLGAIRPGQGAFKNPQVEEMASLSRQHQVPLTAGELKGKAPIMKGAETNLEKVPLLGTAGFRKQQSAAAEKAARRVVDSVRGSVLDVGETISSGLQTVLKSRKAEAKIKYDQVETLLKAPGVQNAIRADQTSTAVTDLLKTYPDLFDRLPAAGVKKKLEALLEARRPGPTAGPFVAQAPGQGPTASITFEEARYLREQLNDYIGRARKSSGAIGSDELRKLSILKKSLDQDIDAFGATLPANSAVHKAFREATDYYRTKVVPFENKAIRPAMKDDVDTDTVFKMFVKPDRPVLAGKAKALMSAKGQQALKYGVLQHAFDEAMDTTTGVFSPQRFSNEIERLGKTNEVIFNPKEKAQLDGLTKLMSAAKRGGQFMENPPTGNRLIQASATGGIVGGGLTAAVTHPATIPLMAASAAATKGLSWLLTSESGKRMLLQAAKTPEQSKAMEELLKRSAVLAARNATVLRGLDESNDEPTARRNPRGQ